MPENLPQKIVRIREEAERFLREVVKPLGDDDSESAARAIRAASREAGFFYKTQPAEFGGAPATTLELTVLRELFAHSNLPLTRHIFGPGPGVLHSVAGRLREEYLLPVMAGEKRGAFGFTEPDTAPRPTRAVLDGDLLIVTGQKSYVTGGATADFVSALVNVEQADGAKAGTAMVVIDRDSPGLTIEREFASLDGSSHVAMRFDKVRVPVDQMIGKPGEGLPRALTNIGQVRMLVSAQATGMCLWVLDYIEEHLKAPHRSGSPLGSREGVRLRFADMQIATWVARSALYRTARLVDSGEDSVHETAMTKVFTSETAGQVVDMGVQLFGGQALVDGHPLARLYRQVRSLRFVEGASDLLRLNIARGKLEPDGPDRA